MYIYVWIIHTWSIFHSYAKLPQGRTTNIPGWVPIPKEYAQVIGDHHLKSLLEDKELFETTCQISSINMSSLIKYRQYGISLIKWNMSPVTWNILKFNAGFLTTYFSISHCSWRNSHIGCSSGHSVDIYITMCTTYKHQCRHENNMSTMDGIYECQVVEYVA